MMSGGVATTTVLSPLITTANTLFHLYICRYSLRNSAIDSSPSRLHSKASLISNLALSVSLSLDFRWSVQHLTLR
jgi:hypothetical protein